MPNLDMTLRDLMRAQDVTRWQIVRCGRTQSVAEHSWAVGIIAQKLWRSFTGGKPGEATTDAELARLAHAAMWHDVPEVFTGDINTPTKIHLKTATGVADLLEQLENTAGVAYTTAVDLPEPMQICLKLADMLEACYFLSEYGQGSYADGQLKGLLHRVQGFTSSVAIDQEWARARMEVWHELCYGETTTFQRVGGIR